MSTFSIPNSAMRSSSDSDSTNTLASPDHAAELAKPRQSSEALNAPNTSPQEGFTNIDLEKATTRGTSRSSKSGHQARRYTTALDWEGEDDPENPRNWTFSKKLWHTCVPGLQCFALTFGSSVYSSGIESVMEDFHVGTVVAMLPLSLYILALGFGPMISAPMSEQYGRRFVYLVDFPIAMLFIVGAGCAQNIQTLVITRFFAGLIGAGPLAVGAGTLMDMYPPIDLALASATFIMMPFLGPAIGPVVGGFAVMAKGWRWTQWEILFAGAIAWAVTIPSKETYKKIILMRRAKKNGLPPPEDPLPKGWAYVKFITTVTLFRPIRMLFTEYIVGSLSIYAGFNFGCLYGFFAAFPLVFSSPYPELQVYHFNLGETGLVFVSLGIGAALGVVVFMYIDRTIYKPKFYARQAQGIAEPMPPEQRLYSAMVGCFLIPIGLFWFAWTARSDICWIVPILACIPYATGNLLVFYGIVMYLVEAYGALAGASAVAANGLFRYCLGAAFPLFASQMFLKMGVGWATSLFGFVTVALMPLPFVFFKYGPRIRANSSYIPSNPPPAAAKAATPAAAPAAPTSPTSAPVERAT